LLEPTCNSGMAEGDGSARNFRSAYYEKLGFCGNDEKNYLDLLIASSPSLDIEKLNDLCERCELDRKCVDTWKILLGVECGRKNPFDDYENVRRVRSEHFQSLRHHLEVLLKHNVLVRSKLAAKSKGKTEDESNGRENDSSKSMLSNSLSENRLITLMYLLEAGQLETSNIDAQLNSEYCRKLSAMAGFFVNVSKDLQEAFFLFRNFTNNILNKTKR